MHSIRCRHQQRWVPRVVEPAAEEAAQTARHTDTHLQREGPLGLLGDTDRRWVLCCVVLCAFFVTLHKSCSCPGMHERMASRENGTFHIIGITIRISKEHDYMRRSLYSKPNMCMKRPMGIK